MESNSFNDFSWVSRRGPKPWKLQFYHNEIKKLASSQGVVFSHVIISANGLVDSLAKQGVLRPSPWAVFLV